MTSLFTKAINAPILYMKIAKISNNTVCFCGNKESISIFKIDTIAAKIEHDGQDSRKVEMT